MEISPETGTIAKYISELLYEEGGFSLFIDYGHSGEKTDTFRVSRNLKKKKKFGRKPNRSFSLQNFPLETLHVLGETKQRLLNFCYFSFQAFKDHKLHDPLVDPGLADLTADVNFSFIKEIMENKLITFGPVDQSDFLLRMKIKTRLEMLLKHVKDEKQGEILQSGYNMIVDKDQMGSRYKFFSAFPAVLKERFEQYPVLGFHDISD